MSEGVTRCNRCSGMMIQEKIYYETEHFWAFKCVYCGEYIDGVILKNRQRQKVDSQKSRKYDEANWRREREVARS